MPEPTKIEIVSRRVQTTSTGMRIERAFSFEPYESFPAVLEALQGTVKQDETGEWKRTLPARDPYIKNCFCNECHLVMPGDDYALTTSKSIQVAVDKNGIKTKRSLKEKLEVEKEKPVDGGVGGHVVAIYRPLITARIAPENDTKPENAFDWIDPTFSPVLKQIPWPDGFFIITGAFAGRNKSVPRETGLPIHIPVIEFSIRQLLVGEPNWDGIDAAAGCINASDFPLKFAGFTKTTLPNMLRGQLKFEAPEVVNRMDAAGNRWYEVTYNFSWLRYGDTGVHDEEGNELPGMQPVTWNHVFMRPSFFGFAANKLGWYHVLRDEATGFFQLADNPLFRISAGSLYNYTNFTHLFATE